jgi:hypothetical protein
MAQPGAAPRSFSAGLLRHPREHDSLEPLRVAFALRGELDNVPGEPKRNNLIAVRQFEFGEDSVEGRTHDGDGLGVKNIRPLPRTTRDGAGSSALIPAQCLRQPSVLFVAAHQGELPRLRIEMLILRLSRHRNVGLFASQPSALQYMISAEMVSNMQPRQRPRAATVQHSPLKLKAASELFGGLVLVRGPPRGRVGSS